jgi:hypothetical protein
VDGVTMDADNVEAVHAWTTLSSVQVVRGFLGLTGYYWKFIQSYSNITTLLMQLLKRESFNWSPEAEAAFNTLKNELTSTPVL